MFSISTKSIRGFYIKDGCSLSLQDILMDFILRMGVLYLLRSINGFYIKDGCSLSLQDLLMDYIDVFGTRPVCFSDIKKYLKAIPLEQRNNFILK